MRKILALFLAAMMMLCCASAFAEGTFRVGMECNYAPYNWTQANASEYAVEIEGGGGYADGYDVQIARKIAEGLGKELVIVKTEWDGLPMGVMTGAFDAIIAGMSPTEERKATIDFTDAYYNVQPVVVVRKDGPYANAKTLADLSGASITGQLNTFHYGLIDQIPGVNKAMAMETFPAMIVALKAGAVDGYIAEGPGAMADTMANPELTYLSFDEGEGFTVAEGETSIAVGLAKGSPLMDSINEILAGISDDERKQIMEDTIARQPLNQYGAVPLNPGLRAVGAQGYTGKYGALGTFGGWPRGRGCPPAPHTAPVGRGGTREKVAWSRSYRRSATGLAARGFGAISCLLLSADRRRATGPPARGRG